MLMARMGPTPAAGGAAMSLIKPLPPEAAGGSPSPLPCRPNAGTDDNADDGVACTALCLYLPRFSTKKRPAVKPRKSARDAEPASDRRATSWSWWPPWSQSRAAASGDAAAAAHGGGDGSASFKHWGQSQSPSRSSRVTPRASSSSSSFSFPSSPASASSFVSTPRLGRGS
ncbi:hypothetical protein BS78_03G305000 [Paspalum vaginatum]|nr:hypothetical protein BS78_03G305000 [Paspalum vaginatum]